MFRVQGEFLRASVRNAVAAIALLGTLGPGAAARAESGAVAANPMRAIAIAEDQRRWSDGELRRYLGHADAGIRARAALATGRLQDSTAVEALLPLLGDPAPEVRREAAFALGQIGSRTARAPLESLLAAPDPELAELAVEALGKLGDRAATPAVARLLGSPTPSVRAEAAVALWRLADSTALPALVERHSDTDPEVRWRVLYALEKIADPDRIVLVAALHLDDPEIQVRAQAVRTLGRQRSTRGTAYALQRLDDPEWTVVVNALRALQQIGDSSCVACAPRVLGALRHAHPYVRVTAATLLAEHFIHAHADTAVQRAIGDSLVVHLADADAATRGAAAVALLASRGAAALPRVEPLLADPSIYARVAVLRGLTRVPADSAALRLLPRLGPGYALFERMTAAEVLGESGVRAALPALRAALADSATLMVAAAASAIAALGDSASVPALESAYAARARDADADARISIRDALRALAGGAHADSVEARYPPANAAPADYPPDFQDPPAVRGAILRTTAGEIEWAFHSNQAPQTVRNFVRLAERGHFDSTAVHRVVPNFVIQDGDPTGTGSGGPGWTIRCEYNRLRYGRGQVGMALSGKDTGGSQWFITHSPQPHLNGRYTIFAQVTRGLEVVDRVVQGDRVLGVEILR